MNSKNRSTRVQGAGWSQPAQTKKSTACSDDNQAKPPQAPASLDNNFGTPKEDSKFVFEHPEEVKEISSDFFSQIVELRRKTAASVDNFTFHKKRVRVLSKVEEFKDGSRGVLYWMSRDQRMQDNWALLYAQRLALKLKVPLHVCFCLVPRFLDATLRHYDFLLRGLEEVERECRDLDINFHLLLGGAKDVLPRFVESHTIGGIVTDFSPLRLPRQWVQDVSSLVQVPFCQVDAHNIVPCWEASPKLEYGSRTIRNKINGQLSTYLTEFPPVIKHPYKAATTPAAVDWLAARQSLTVNSSVGPVSWATPGTVAGLKMLESFISERLQRYNTDRNNPNKDAQSNLSPWFHFGQVGVQRAMLMVQPYRSRYKEAVEKFMDEGVVWRELGDNFCFYNENYDNLKGCYEWAMKTLDIHRNDKRQYLYSRDDFEKGRSHDKLWNSAQIQLVLEGKMHGFLRMYWAKKILEWSSGPDEALGIAIYLNDKYNLDGRDPNGYAGCMWSIGGMHDEGFDERPIFGKIRYMSYEGCKRKFDVAAFEQRYSKRNIDHLG